ncbi:HEAT repeat domain-containing protein [Desulfovibrio aminophilus]|nr:HEAT repeat domain-containing protein [Desulfovibrio aminophilus]MCM0756153.1 HEAT repeat domain-containing protein [Desulfovibrio aminophilus]
MLDCKSIIERLGSDDSEVLREAAFEAGEARCEEAVPHLAKLLQSSNLGVQEAADRALRSIGGQKVIQVTIPLLRVDDAPARNLAMDILRALASQDVAALIPLIRDPDTDIRIFAADILGATDNPAAVPVLGEALLKDPEVNVRYQAAVSLGTLARPEAAESLNKAMEDEEWVQYAVIEALSKIKHSSSVGALVKAMARTSDLVTSMIIDALGEMGNIKAVPMLLKRLEESPTALRNKIVKAVVRILGGKSLQLLSRDERENLKVYMLVALEDEDLEVQDAAIQGLAFVGGERASEAVLKIASHLDPDRDQERLQQTVRALAQIGLTSALRSGLLSGDADEARVAVMALAFMDDASVPQVLMDAFWKHGRDLQRQILGVLSKTAGPSAKQFFLDVLDRHEDGKVIKSVAYFLGQKLHLEEAADRLFALLEHKYDDVKEAGLEACIAIGGPRINARFREFYESDDPVKRLMAVYAFGRMGQAEHWEALKAALEDEVPDIRKVALEAIAGMCWESDAWLPLLEGRLKDESREVRLTAIDLMGRCYRPEVIPYLLGALDDEDDWVKVRALDALGFHKEREAVPSIVPLLVNPNRLVVLKAVEALGSIGGTSAFRALLDVSTSEEPELQQAVETSIAKIQEEHETGE